MMSNAGIGGSVRMPYAAWSGQYKDKNYRAVEMKINDCGEPNFRNEGY